MTTDTFVVLFNALEDLEETLRITHPDLPLAEHEYPTDRALLLADVVLLFIDNLRAATQKYQREAHLTRHFPPR